MPGADLSFSSNVEVVTMVMQFGQMHRERLIEPVPSGPNKVTIIPF